MITLMAPWALLLLVVLPAAAVLGFRRVQRLPGRRPAATLALRLLVLGLLVAALAGPQWRTLERRVSVIFVIDASASVGPSGQHAAMAWATRAVAAGGPLDQAGLVLFGAAPRLVVPLAHYRALPDPSGDPAGATNIGAALRLALSLVPPATAGRVVLLSDGQATSGDVNGALALALTRGIPIDTVAIAPPKRQDVAVRELSVPAAARVGDRIPVRITLYSTSATNATLTLWVDGQAARQTIALPAGVSVLGIDQRLDTIGLHTFHVRIDAPGDAMPQNNDLYAATVAAPPGRVLFAVSNPAAATALATTLARAHVAVIPTLAADLPHSAAAYHGYDAVVLDDVPATALSRDQQTALRAAVYAHGLGLLAVGGASSFSLGGYAHTPLEDVLPVLSISTPRRVGAPLALMLVIDKSGSMADAVDGVAKVDMVKVAASSALDRLSDGDGIGVLAFDDTNHWIVPFHTLQGVADKAHIRHQIATLGADGDTYIYPALQKAEAAVMSMRTPYRHIVLLTDGQGEDAPFDTLIRRMHREHITLSTIGVGQDVVQDELKQWAKLGGGLFHYVSDPHDIPRIVINETRFGAAGSGEVHGTIHLGVAAASPLVRAMAGRTLPTIGAYDSTLPKGAAQVAVQAASGDPVLASWQYGLGRVVAWTSDAPGTSSGGAAAPAAGWAPQWSPNRVPDFWSDLVRWTMHGYTPGAAVPSLQRQDGALQVSAALRTASGAFDDAANPRVRVVAPGGAAQVVPLALTGPGLYTARLPLSGAGLYTATFVRNDRGPRSAADVAALAVPYAAEYADDGVDSAFLTHVAAATGGQVLARPADAFAHSGLPPAVEWRPLWPLFLTLAMLCFILDVAVRLLLPPDPMFRRAAR